MEYRYIGIWHWQPERMIRGTIGNMQAYISKDDGIAKDAQFAGTE